MLGVVVDTPGDAVDAVRALMGSEAGRGVALPIEVGCPAGRRRPAWGRAFWARRRILFAADMRLPSVSIQSLLGNVVVVEDIDAAQAAWCNGSQGIVCVTLKGEMIHANGAVEGGLGRNAGFLERSRRCEEVRLKAEQLEAQVHELEPISEKLSEQLMKAEQETVLRLRRINGLR